MLNSPDNPTRSSISYPTLCSLCNPSNIISGTPVGSLKALTLQFLLFRLPSHNCRVTHINTCTFSHVEAPRCGVRHRFGLGHPIRNYSLFSKRSSDLRKAHNFTAYTLASLRTSLTCAVKIDGRKDPRIRQERYFYDNFDRFRLCTATRRPL